MSDTQPTEPTGSRLQTPEDQSATLDPKGVAQHRFPAWALIVWVLVILVFLIVAIRQKQALNLSPTAGGQYPYLQYAAGIAHDGAFTHVGDRNRMPLVPFLVSFAFDEDPQAFLDEAASISIALAVVAILLVGVATWWTLGAAWGTVMLALAAGISASQAAFVQAEVLFYALLFVTWLMLARLLVRPDWRWGLASGCLLALAYLTKASALPLLWAFLVVAALRWLVGRRGERGPDIGRLPLAAGAVAVAFFLITAPYHWENLQRFGRPFYNVNSTFFMWCDGWQQAKDFADRYHVEQQWPQADAAEIPSPGNYFAHHTAGHALRRLGYGFAAMAHTIVDRGLVCMILLLVALAALAIGRHRRAARSREQGRMAVIGFTLLTCAGYLLAYAWYAQVAYGDRFVRSLILPVTFLMLWLSLGKPLRQSALPLSRLRRPTCIGLAILVLLAAGQPLAHAWRRADHPSREFILFYFNETLELQQAGHLEQAAHGFEAITNLEPNFAPAHLAWGMTLLYGGDPSSAIPKLAAAVSLDPENAEAFNGLGSAFVQTGRYDEAIGAFVRATERAPRFATAWFNLGGTLCLARRFDEAEQVQRQLARLDEGMARRLAALIAEQRQPTAP